MNTTVELPLWLFVLILLFAAVTFASHFLFPSVRWFFRRRLERAVKRLNERLERPIEPFKLTRRYDMIQRLVYDPEVNRSIVEHAHETGVPEAVAFQQAKSYAREIVPSFSASAYFGFAIRVARFLSNALYRVRLVHVDEEGLRTISRDSTVIFVMNHRSNMDYVLVTYLAAERSALAYAVGEWAQVWPLSRLIRAMGAYFIRRRSRNALYRKVLARYVALATQGGVTQALFPEGGLSLDGAIQPPKLGLLKYLTDAYTPDGRDVVFVPVALNYDRVLEDRILLRARDGGGRRFRARISVVAWSVLKLLWRRVRGRYRKFGYAAVSFGHPLSLRAFSAGHGGDLTKPLARELMQRIEAAVPVLPVPMVASILQDATAPLSRAQVQDAFAARIEALKDAHVYLPEGESSRAVEAGLRALCERQVIAERGGVFAIDPAQADTVAFYANSIRHFRPDSGFSASAKS
ncbi:glycerol-3-phosphate acyltransferase [Salinihabitans flavidus]|uniref:Glycerol-3-phosphate acyltransferase n=1 Tax=Salinihabitans flavidus TaxID=569882 RepID=A0A1H8VHS8_9RHOB|nr:1-acyl-sn-glycerol-3-phosphate acyltransferase [Salinihabitans flavidus]SEP14767.1 glycerol-3-phosphate acyltransferase [Salinihabitans flavidus]